MAIEYECTIPRLPREELKLRLETGRSIIIIGANGSGKTRLGVYIENRITAQAVHRIAAQKSLALTDANSIMSLERADNFLRFGTPDGSEGHKAGNRWGSKPAIHMLSDFDALLQRLFAAHNRIAIEHLQERKTNPNIPVPSTKFDDLKIIWDGLLPHRVLIIQEASVKVRPPSADAAQSYPGSEMSDGERAIFYFLGQCLVAPENGAIIIDEPESHIHKAIVGPLWDAIEKARPDCGFIYITHDLDFAVARTASTKYFIRSYSHEPQSWDIDEFPQDTGLPEQVVAELVGSRKPILFVEGERGSLDLTIYRSQYGGFTIVPIGSCDAVIHSVASYKRSAALHWLGVGGLIDADDRDSTEVANLESGGVYTLPVAEVENILLLPLVFLELAKALLCADPAAKLELLRCAVMTDVSNDLEGVVARYTLRRLDRRLKRVTVAATDLGSLQSTYQTELATIDPATIFAAFKVKLANIIQTGDLAAVLTHYDNKGLLARAATILGLKDQKQLLEKLSRLLAEKDHGKRLRDQLNKVLPAISV